MATLHLRSAGRFASMAGGLGPLALALLLAGCAGSDGSGSGAAGGGQQCNDGSWCGSRLDRNGDGQVSQQEMDDAFKAADTNGDGQLSQNEFTAAGGSWGGGGRGR